jgi:hypothetical protein
MHKVSYKYLFPIEPTGRAVAASGDGIMLTKLLQFQAQGWEIRLSRITFTRGTDSLKSIPKLGSRGMNVRRIVRRSKTFPNYVNTKLTITVRDLSRQA